MPDTVKVTGLEPGTLQRMKENKQFWKKVQQSLQFLFSLEAYEDIMENSEKDK